MKLKHFLWSMLCAIAASITTYKLTLLYFYYIAATNDTTAPFAAFITAIPIGFTLFHISIQFYKVIIHFTRHTLRAIA